MKHLPIEFAMTVYYEEYWRENDLDDLADIDFNLAYEIFEAGVNCGVCSTIRIKNAGEMQISI